MTGLGKKFVSNKHLMIVDIKWIINWILTANHVLETMPRQKVYPLISYHSLWHHLCQKRKSKQLTINTRWKSKWVNPGNTQSAANDTFMQGCLWKAAGPDKGKWNRFWHPVHSYTTQIRISIIWKTSLKNETPN